MSLPTYPFDSAEFLDDAEAVAAYAEAVLEDGDPQLYPKAVDVIARATGLTLLAERSGMSRAELIEALRTDHEERRQEIVEKILASVLDRTGRDAAE